jgi:hypothetical protein
MREMQRIKRIITPLLKGLPIKLDDWKYGMSRNHLFEDFDVFSSENKIETEAEILKSPLLIGKTLEVMHLDVMVTRIGMIKKTILFHDNPFQFEYDKGNSKLFNKTTFIERIR